MPSGPPPSRYRVIERGRRLQVIDTWAAVRPRSAMADYEAAYRVDDGDAAQPPADMMADAGPIAPRPSFAPPDPETARVDPVPDMRPQPPSPPRTAEMMAPPELLRNVAATVCGNARDRDGRLQFTTASFFDSRGPRAIALDPDGERELGLTVLVAVALVAGGVLFAVSLGWPGIVLGFVAIGLARQVKLIATPWLDRLAGRTR